MNKLLIVFALACSAIAKEWNFDGFDAAQKRWPGKAREAVRAEAEKGDRLAQYYLGRLNHDETNLLEAIVWYTKAAAQGSGTAQGNLANVYLAGGPGVPRDSARAINLLREAVDTGHPTILDKLARAFLMSGKFTEAVGVYEKEIARGNAEAICGLGYVYIYPGPNKDESKAQALFKKAADAGSALGMVETAAFLIAAKQYREATVLLEKAREKVPSDRLHRVDRMLGYLYFHDFNWDRSIEAYERCAALGDPDSMRELALIYTINNGKPDKAKADAWRRKAAAAGDEESRQQLAQEAARANESEEALIERFKQEAARGDRGVIDILKNMQKRGKVIDIPEPGSAFTEEFNFARTLETGEGRTKDPLAAAQIYLRIAQVHGPSGARLAAMYEKGEGISQDLNKAAFYFYYSYLQSEGELKEKSGQRFVSILGSGQSGYSRADAASQLTRLNSQSPQLNFQIGKVFEEGKGVNADIVQAVAYFTRAAEAGSPEAQNHLGELWKRGVDGNPDLKEAQAWFQKAAAQNFKPAIENLQQLKSKI